MKRWLILLILPITGWTACAPDAPEPVTAPDGTTISSPVSYNDYFISLQNRIIKEMEHFTETMEKFDTAAMAKDHRQLVQTIKNSIDTARKVPPYHNDTLLKPAFVALFTFYKSVAVDEYETIVSILSKGQSAITDKDLTTIDSLTRQIAMQETKIKGAFTRAQRKFAERYNLKVGNSTTP